MPPAFNLSQDQTLQFNLCWLAFLPYPFRDRSLKILTRSVLANLPIFTSCEHFNVLSIQISPKASLHRTPSSAHTYRLLVVKEPCLARFALHKLRCICSASLPSNRFVCQQQRNEIMKHFFFFVNYFLQNFLLASFRLTNRSTCLTKTCMP